MVPAFWQPEHLHVMLNHLPVTLILLLAPLLAVGLISRNPAVFAIAFALGLLGDLVTPFVMQTGERAYDRFNGAQIQPPLDDRGDIAMEMHEDAAEKAAPFIYITGLGCIAGLVFLRWRPDWVRGILVHLHGNVPPVIEWRLDLVPVETVIGAFSGLHHEGGGEVAQKAKRKGDSENRRVAGDQADRQQRGEEKYQGNGEVVEHHMEVLGLPEGGDHGSRVG